MTELAAALQDPRPSARLRAVMAAGTRADVADLDLLVAQCAVEDDFSVRDTLTWALLRLPADHTVPVLLGELRRPERQAVSQALHTLSKIADPRSWPAVREHIGDPRDDVARPAWRAAVAVVPDAERAELARDLARGLGRGDRETRLALSRALVALGEGVLAPALERAVASRSEAVRQHAADTERLLRDPDAGSAVALERARREVALGRTRGAVG